MLQQPLWITVLFVYYFHFTDDENKVLILSDFPNDTQWITELLTIWL